MRATPATNYQSD